MHQKKEAKVRPSADERPMPTIRDWPKYDEEGNQRQGHDIEEGHMYFIRDARQWVGNCALWWAPEGRGYTCDLAQAGEFTAKQTSRLARRETDIPYRVDLVRAVATIHVTGDALSDLDATASITRECTRRERTRNE